MSHVNGTATSPALAAWPDRPTAAQRTGAQHAVARLFDALAPQKPPARRDGPAPAIQRHRSPSGCILQAATRAVAAHALRRRHGPGRFRAATRAPRAHNR